MNDGGQHSSDTQKSTAAVTGRGHRVTDSHFGDAPAQPIAETIETLNNQVGVVSAGDERCQTTLDAHRKNALLIAELREVHRMRQDLIQPHTALTNRIKSIGRRMNGEDQLHIDTHGLPAFAPDFAALFLINGRKIIHQGVLATSLRMCHIVRQFPIYPWMKDIYGFGEIGLAQIIGEAGDLSRFSTVSKLWKWMGVAVMPDGKRQRLIAGLGPRENPYNPQRHAILSTIGDSLMRKDNSYREYYLEIKKRQPEKWPDASDGHIHNHALRLMEKRLLRNLWREWKRLHGAVEASGG